MPLRPIVLVSALAVALTGCATQDVKSTATQVGAALGVGIGIAAAAVTRQSGFWAYDLSAKGGALAGAVAGYILGEAEEEERRREPQKAP